MRFLLFLLLTIPVVAPQTLTMSQDPADLVVIKFEWAAYTPPSGGLIHSAQNRQQDGPMTVNRSAIKTDPDSLRNAREAQERRADLQEHVSSMQAALKDAARSGRVPAKLYVYRIQVKNEGSRLIKSFVWEYLDAPGLAGSRGRQFLCTEKTRPDHSKGLEALSPRAPSILVEATGGDKTTRGQRASVIINRIEYGDGSVWQRPNWDSSILSRRPQPKVGGSKCVGI